MGSAGGVVTEVSRRKFSRRICHRNWPATDLILQRKGSLHCAGVKNGRFEATLLPFLTLMSVPQHPQALYWFNYELVKNWLSGLRPKDQPSVGISFVAGGISGTVS